MHFTIASSCREQAPDIARLIMTAMTDECCLHFCGDGYGLDDFHRMMTLLVLPDCRHMGIARQLIQATKEKADRLHLPCVGLTR